MSLYTEIRQCAICGKDFSARRKCSKYCSKECRAEGERINKQKWQAQNAPATTIFTKTCPVCGEDFETLRNSQIYCSIKCKRTANRAILKVPVKIKKCVICGAEFETNKPDTLTCSKECSYRHHLNICNKRNESVDAKHVCPVCGEDFVPYRNTQVYCSSKCRDVDTVLRKCQKSKDLRLEHKFKDEAYTEIHRDIFIVLMRKIFRRNVRKKRILKTKTLDDWIRESDACRLSYGKYRAAVEVFHRTFEELKNANVYYTADVS